MQFNPYRVLHVPTDADDQTIKRAYRDLAMRWHPDKNPDNLEVAEEMFGNISKAYDILSDPEKRKKYDLSKPLPYRSNASSYHGPTPWDRKVGSCIDPRQRPSLSSSFDHLYNVFYEDTNLSRNASNEDFDSKDSLAPRPFTTTPNLAKKSQSPDPKHSHPVSRANSTNSVPFHSRSFTEFDQNTLKKFDPPLLKGDIQIDVNVTLEEIFQCATKMIVVQRSIDGNIQNKNIKVTLTPGITNGTTIVLKNQGNRDSPDDPHDMIFTIKEIPHSRFIRIGDDIIENITITLRDAISNSYKVDSVAVDEQPVSLEIQETIQPEEEFRVKERGMHKNGTKEHRGDHIFKFHITIPIFTEEQRTQMIQIMDT